MPVPDLYNFLLSKWFTTENFKLKYLENEKILTLVLLEDH